MRTVENIIQDSTWMKFFKGRVLKNCLYLTSMKILELTTYLLNKTAVLYLHQN